LQPIAAERSLEIGSKVLDFLTLYAISSVKLDLRQVILEKLGNTSYLHGYTNILVVGDFWAQGIGAL
jgi:hypothetical protein